MRQCEAPLKIAFVVPAYHAERTIAAVVGELLSLASTLHDRTTPAVVVVDDGSSDETFARAKDAVAWC